MASSWTLQWQLGKPLLGYALQCRGWEMYVFKCMYMGMSKKLRGPFFTLQGYIWGQKRTPRFKTYPCVYRYLYFCMFTYLNICICICIYVYFLCMLTDRFQSEGQRIHMYTYIYICVCVCASWFLTNATIQYLCMYAFIYRSF